MNYKPTQIIKSNPDFKKEKPKHKDFLYIAEFFCDTIQGEGINIGYPAAFLRMQYCTQSCSWCDTKAVWRYGNPYTFDELFTLMDKHGLPDKLRHREGNSNGGQHLVLTGGSPMRQQEQLLEFLRAFIGRYGFRPYVEIENECTILPSASWVYYANIFNNSPKLKHSGNPDKLRYQPEILEWLSESYVLSWFKFVVNDESHWDEISKDFIEPGLIKKDQVILMPLGATREELQKNTQVVVKIAIKNGVRYCTREHINLWDKATGV